MKTNRRNESEPSRLVRELAACLIYGLAGGTVAGGVVLGLGLLIGVQATVGLVCGLGIGSALVMFRDWLS